METAVNVAKHLSTCASKRIYHKHQYRSPKEMEQFAHERRYILVHHIHIICSISLYYHTATFKQI